MPPLFPNGSTFVPEYVDIFQPVFDQLALLEQSNADATQSPNLAMLAFDRTVANGTVSHARLSIFRRENADVGPRGEWHEGIPDIVRQLQAFTYQQSIPHSGRESYWIFG